ncbi:down syndrome critical region protein 3 [Ochromonadaceae sp. CCMP2298]|nr:down syndrome critical region protein 3 [Ochromonadaceae sp. CCMP2298]|mmetsp:Transcript_4352/g.9763  ORF Transcript_4352/g.9763 Transcript_4352/m.9763 type:complete len:304 (+) Transcript_4352:98-1009(+)
MSQPEKSSIEVKLSRMDRVYRQKDRIEGTVIVNAFKGWSHTGINMVVLGAIHLNHSGRGVSAVDAVIKPIEILHIEKEVCPAGKFGEGVVEIPFDFAIKAVEGQSLVESYHGVYISILYTIVVTCERGGFMQKALKKELEFLVEIPSSSAAIEPLAVPFNISPESLENVSAQVLATIPRFRITGKLNKSKCPITQPLTGEVVVEESPSSIRSIELQLVRVETVVGPSARTLREATEIQNIQIGDGNVSRNLSVPMYMVFPRLFSCPTVVTPTFKIEFEVNLVVVFGDGYMITENFPLLLFRDQ